MNRMPFLQALLLAFLLGCVFPGPARAQDSLWVRLKLVNGLGQALAGVEVRAVSSLEAGWQMPDAGEARITGEDGTACWILPQGMATRRRKRPTNFLTQLFSPRLATQYAAIAVELEWLNHPWRVVVEGDRFEDGTTVQPGRPRIYGRDAVGCFTRPVIQRNGGWDFPGVPGRLTTPGITVQRFVLDHEPRGWALDLVLERLPDPVIR